MCHKIQCLGIEVYYQVAMQITLLLLTSSTTATTSGLQTIFKQDSFMGIPMTATNAIIFSTVWSLKTSMTLHWKAIRTQKVLYNTKAKLCAWLWGLMGSLRRIFSMVCFFIPCLGLFNILNHSLAEQYPFVIRTKYNLRHPKDEINLFNMTETVLWSEVDRWNYYEDIDEPTPPSYSQYTGFTLKWNFLVFMVIVFFNGVSITLVKYFTSEEYKQDTNTFNKLIHVAHNINLAVPYRDWDDDNKKCSTKEEFKQRCRDTETEMIWSQLVNMFFSITMLIPIWFTGDLYSRYVPDRIS